METKKEEKPPFILSPQEVQDFNQKFAAAKTTEAIVVEIGFAISKLWPRFQDQMSFDNTNIPLYIPDFRINAGKVLNNFYKAPNGEENYLDFVMASLWNKAADALEKDYKPQTPPVNGKV